MSSKDYLLYIYIIARARVCVCVCFFKRAHVGLCLSGVDCLTLCINPDQLFLYLGIPFKRIDLVRGRSYQIFSRIMGSVVNLVRNDIIANETQLIQNSPSMISNNLTVTCYLFETSYLRVFTTTLTKEKAIKLSGRMQRTLISSMTHLSSQRSIPGDGISQHPVT